MWNSLYTPTILQISLISDTSCVGGPGCVEPLTEFMCRLSSGGLNMFIVSCSRAHTHSDCQKIYSRWRTSAETSGQIYIQVYTVHNKNVRLPKSPQLQVVFFLFKQFRCKMKISVKHFDTVVCSVVQKIISQSLEFVTKWALSDRKGSAMFFIVNKQHDCKKDN